jgi:hypothetical protein
MTKQIVGYMLLSITLLIGVMALINAWAQPAGAQQPGQDGIDIDYDADTCVVSLDFEDGTDDSTVLESSVQTGAVLVNRPDILINDVVGDQSQILATFTVDVGTHVVSATLFSGAEELDSETQEVTCEPAPTPTATEEPTATPEPTATEEPEQPTPIIIIVEREPIPTLTATTAPPPATGTIRPPSTGDGGLR